MNFRSNNVTEFHFFGEDRPPFRRRILASICRQQGREILDVVAYMFRRWRESLPLLRTKNYYLHAGVSVLLHCKDPNHAIFFSDG